MENKSIIFFENKKYSIKKLFPKNTFKKNSVINFVKSLNNAKQNDLTFYDSKNYFKLANSTKASYCITTKKLADDLPQNVEKIIVKNVLFELAKILKKIFPTADIDYPDLTVKKPLSKNFKFVKFGNNVLIGNKVKIGKNSIIGSNTIIEPIMIVFMGVMIGGLMIAMYSPIFNVGAIIGQ